MLLRALLCPESIMTEVRKDLLKNFLKMRGGFLILQSFVLIAEEIFLGFFLINVILKNAKPLHLKQEKIVFIHQIVYQERGIAD